MKYLWVLLAIAVLSCGDNPTEPTPPPTECEPEIVEVTVVDSIPYPDTVLVYDTTTVYDTTFVTDTLTLPRANQIRFTGTSSTAWVVAVFDLGEYITTRVPAPVQDGVYDFSIETPYCSAVGSIRVYGMTGGNNIVWDVSVGGGDRCGQEITINR